MIYRGRWEITLSFHATMRAVQKGITEDIVKATLKNGKMKWFAKNNVLFTCKYKMGTVVCVGELKESNTIKIFTVEWR